MLSISCYACRSNNTRKIGLLDKRDGAFSLANPGFLYHCQECRLFFRHPYLHPHELLEYYKHVPSDIWIDNEDRPDFELASSLICERMLSGRILDVGCHTGDFLDRLPKSFEKFGVELSEDARLIAQQKHIKILADSLETCELGRPYFHIITLIDVIEHVLSPIEFLQKVRSLLLPKGILIVSTGDTDALLWRLLRLEYWYYWPEHVTFYNRGWFKWAAAEIGFTFDYFQRFPRFKGTLTQQLVQLKLTLRHRILSMSENNIFLRQALRTSRYVLGKPSSLSTRAPYTHFWPDHMIVILRKSDR